MPKNKMNYIFIVLLFIMNFQITYAQEFHCNLNKSEIEMYDLLEISITFEEKPACDNPFKDINLLATFTDQNGKSITIEGFCDSQPGKIFKVRFMPTVAGNYQYKIIFKDKHKTRTTSGSFQAIPSKRNGPIRVDQDHPWHFVYENTGKHYFWNSTTTYWLAGWKDLNIIRESIDRLAGLGINRIRVGINGRSHGGERWYEPNVVECDNFTLKLNPWIAENPDELDNPGFDVTRFNVAHWQKLDFILSEAKEHGIIVSLIFYVDGLDHGCDPFKLANMGNENEQLYYAYAAARFSAYENVMWDIANEYHLFRTPEWAEKMGNFLKSTDPNKHVISVHGSGDFPFRKSPWVDVVMYQSWDECGGYPFIMNAKRLQEESGRILPIVNEEYGYEESYPPWGCGATASKERPDGRSAENRSQLAWEICMAGAYQTTGERADFGTGAGEDTGGGWINGRGNDKMTMLRYYRIMKETFEKTKYWELSPGNNLVSFGNLCLANVGEEYLVYTRVQHCRLQLPPHQHYSVMMINPVTGEQASLPDADSDVDNNAWQYRKNLEGNWIFILKRK